MRAARTILAAVLLLCAGAACALGPKSAQPAVRNVLLIAVDDLRPQLGCLGDRIVRSPNIDRLAARGTVFRRAYCQQAVCSPSRTSLMTGRRPDTTGVYDLNTHFRPQLPDVVTLSQLFRQRGHVARSFGKIYHPGFDDPPSWSAPNPGPGRPQYGPDWAGDIRRRTQIARMRGIDLRLQRNRVYGPAWEAPDIADDELRDGAIAGQAVQTLREVKDRPFFLAVGFLKPHLPFVAPKRYWDLYSPGAFEPAANQTPPVGAPPYALTNWGELRGYLGIPKSGPVPPDLQRTLIHGYYACISYMDAQVGRVLDELDRLGLRESTAVVLWGDHGWQLGEHGMWCKHTNYEVATRTTLIASVPGQAAPGSISDGLVELVDVFPTLADSCGVPLPKGLEGTSFRPLLDRPDRPWKKAAFSQYPRTVAGPGRLMGYAIRTDRYRMVEWRGLGNEFREYELYDHRTDPQENRNVAGLRRYRRTMDTLKRQLRDGWQAARPAQEVAL